MARIGQDIAKASILLRSGGVVAIPTETVYGLAANALDADAVVKIYDIKQRPFFDPLIIHVSGKSALMRYIEHISPLLEDVMEAFCPGPITFLLPKRDMIPEIVTSGLPNVAIRIPCHPLTLQLLEMLPFPLAAPSANPFGYISPTSAQHVADQLGDAIPYILDGGECHVGVESTIISEENGNILVHRLGGISVEDLYKITRHVHLAVGASSNPKTPGQLDSHYAPRKSMLLRAKIEDYTKEDTGYLTFGKNAQSPHHLDLSPSRNLHEAAVHLFAYMRLLDANTKIKVIEAELLPEEGLGKAINDRLRRASIIV